MSNPYDPYPSPGDQPQNRPPNQPPNPYGQPQQGGYPSYPAYGGGPGSGYGGPGGQPPKGNDPVSITGFVLSLTCCLSLVGVILGAIGLRRTKQPGGHRGRWAAVAAIAIGIPLTLASAGAAVFFAFLATSAITPDNAEAGTCTSIENEDDTVFLREQDCDSPHDGEIVFVGTVGRISGALVEEDFSVEQVAEEVCSTQMDPEDAALVTDDYDWNIATEDPADPDSGDRFICYIQRTDGEQMDAPVVG